MKRLLLLTVVIVYCLVSQGQAGQFYTSEKLSSNLISSICQDKTGYIWIGTEYGLNKFDGYRFTNYFNEAGNDASLISNNVCKLFVDSRGRLWVGTGTGLVVYNPSTDGFERVQLDSNRRPRVNDILQEDDNHLLIGTAGYGLFRVDINNLKVELVTDYAHADDNNYFSHMYIDEKGNFWKAGTAPVVSFRQNDPKHTIRTYDSPFGTVTSFVGFEGGVLMVCQHGLMYCRDGQVFTDFIDMHVLEMDEVQLRTAYTDRQGNIFIGTMGKGLCWIPKGTHQLQRYDYTSNIFDLNTSNVWALFEDKEDNLWIGCLNRGILLLPQHAPLFSAWSFSAQNYSIGGSITSITEGDNRMTWCTVQNNGVYGFDANGKLVAHPQAPSSTYSIYRDKNGGYWVGTSNGLYAYDPLTGHSRMEVSFLSNYINVMTDDGQGHFYFSTYAKGFCAYDLKTKTLRNFTMAHEEGVTDRLHNDWVMAMQLDSRGLLWLGTSSNLCCYDPQKDTFLPFGWETQLEGMTVNAIYEDSQNRMLFGTDNGLFLYDFSQAKVIPFPGAELLSNKVVNKIVEDQYGDLWCSTMMGIWRYDQRQKRFVSYIYGNGLEGREYVRNVGFRSTDNRISFAFSAGITSFSPTDLRKIKQKQENVHLTGVYIGTNSVNCTTLSDGEYVITKPLDENRHFTFSYLDNTFSMEFSTLNSNTENIIYEYRLNGAKEWSNTGVGNNVVSFHHLQPGSYSIEVRANDDGVYTEPVTYWIVVRAPWYRSAWAYLIYIITGLSMIGFMVWFYVRKRGQELDEEKMKFLINATHDIRSPLTLIMSPLHKLMKRDLDSEMKTDLQTIAHNAERIQNLVNQILDIRKIDKQQMQLQCQETDMVQYVGNLLKSYEYTAKERNITFRYTPELDKLMVWFDRKSVDKVVDNLLSNAFKYTYDDGEIEVHVSEGPNQTAQLQVIDNGMGIKGDAQKLFDRFYQGSASRSLHIDGTGIGLNLCKMMVEMHHGTIEAANREDEQGSIFTVRLPLGNSHLTKEQMLDMQEKEKTQKPKPKSNYRVMVVDDDEEIGTYISQELGGYYHIKAVTNGREAMRLLLGAEPDKQFDLVVSDVMMPEMDGFTLLRMIKTNMNISHIPVVMLTSKSAVSNRLEGLEKGADAFLAKPFDMDELHVVINNLISKNLRLKGKFSGTQQQKDKVVETKVKGNDEILMERIMKVINEHLDDSDFNVETLTTEVGISRAQLHRKMKEMTGLPISEFIRNIRLEQAARLLKEQKINVTQVAYAVGFSNLAHFSTVFRKQFGVSPSEFIEQNT